MRTSWTIRLGGGAAFGCLILWSFFSSADIRAFRKQFVTPGMNRILVRVFDAQTRAPLAARVSFTDSQGEYYPPYGHPRKIPAGPWGGDLALPNGKNHAYVDGTFETELPSAQIRLQVSRGFEYDVFKQAFLPSELPDGILEVPLRRWVNMEEKGVHPVNGEVPPVKGRPWKLPHYANRGKTSSSGGELASARSCFSTVRTALGKLRITGLLARFDVARSFPQFPRPLLLQPTIWTSERGADLGSGRCQPRPHLPIYRMTRKRLVPG